MRNLFVYLSLTCSILGLILIYIASINVQPLTMPIKEINSDLIGRSVKTTGYIVYKNSHPSGHLFLTIEDDEHKIQVPLFSGYLNSINLTNKDFKKGNKISVVGLVDEHKGRLQIIPRKIGDVKIII